MNIIFCLSNLFVPYTLTLINRSNSKVLVYTDQEGMYKFFSELSLPNVEVYFRKDLRIGRDLKSAKRILTIRNEVLDWLIQKNPQQVYFFHNIFGSIENWVIKKLSTKSNVFHIPVFNEFPFEAVYNIKSAIGILKNLYVHGILTEPLWDGSRFIHRIPEKFFINNNINRLEIDIDEEYINNVISTKFEFLNKEIVLLTGAVIGPCPIDKDEYITKINDLINAIGKDRIIAKPHPRFQDRYGLEGELEVIPYYIPANMLYNIFNIFVGYDSSVLSEAADCNLKSVSTIDYIKSNSRLQVKNYKNYLINNSKSGNILFPKNINELKYILKNN